MNNATPTPAGWYRDPAGVERWWDGASWGGSRNPAAEIVLRPDHAPTTYPPASAPAAYPQQGAPFSAPGHPYAGAPGMVVSVSLKESGTAYLLAIFLGGFAAHRFYMNRPGSAIAMLLLWQFGAWTAWLGIGLVLVLAAAIWWIVDLCTMSGMVAEENRRRMAMHGHRPF